MWRGDYVADSEILAWDTLKWLYSTLRKVADEPGYSEQVSFRWQTTDSGFPHENWEHLAMKSTNFYKR